MISNIRRSRIAFVLGISFCAALASCNDDDKEDLTVTSVAGQEIRNTTDLDDPIVLNDLSFSASDTTETDLPSEI